MNRDMTHCAGLVLLSLIVKGRSARDRRIDRKGVTFEAKQVGLAPLQQPRVRRAVRNMAAPAALRLDGAMLEDERPSLVRVTFEAKNILRRSRPQLFRNKAAVLVVTISTLHQFFVHTVMKRFIEIGLRLQMTAIAEFRLTLHKQELGLFRMMRRMAIRTADVVDIVGRARKIAVFFPVFVALEAAFTHLLGGDIFEGKYFGLVASRFHVLLARSVTRLATLPLGPPMGVKGSLPVGCFLQALENIRVAGLARFRPNVLRGIQPITRVAFLGE